MPSRVKYCCLLCGGEYTPVEASRRWYWCCNQPLENVELTAAERPRGKTLGGQTGQRAIGSSEGERSRFGRLLDAAVGELFSLISGAQPAPGASKRPQGAERARGEPTPREDRPGCSSPPGASSRGVSTELDEVSARGAEPGPEAQEELQLVEIIPPAENEVDALQMGNLLSSLGTDPDLVPLLAIQGELFSLEIAGDEDGKHFYFRTPASLVEQIQQRLKGAYKAVDFRLLPPEEDPATKLSGAVAQGVLSLHKPCINPLKTYADGDFRDADPIQILLSSFDGCRAGEVAHSQLILKRAPSNWARLWVGSKRKIESGPLGPTMSVRGWFLITVAVVSFVVPLIALAWAFMSWRGGNPLPACLVAFLAPLSFGLLYVVASRTPGFTSVDPERAYEKLQKTPYDFCLRLSTCSPERARASSRLRNVISSYKAFDMPSGNFFDFEHVSFDPALFPIIHSTVGEAGRQQPFEWGDVLRAMWCSLFDRWNRMSVDEISSMWHLPVGEVTGLALQLSKQLIPRADFVSEGVPIAHSGLVSVHLSPEALRAHSLIVGKTQKGKSNLMQHVAAAAMKILDTAVVVLEPHGDLTHSLLGLVPEERVRDVIYIDFSNEERVVGFNIFDLRQGRSKDKIVSNLVHMGTHVWGTFWGPRMESALRYASKTLLGVNETLIRRHEHQFTILDLNYLFNFPPFRQFLLENYEQPRDLLSWWYGFDRLPPYMQEEVPNPVKTKIDRFAEAASVRRTIGQSDSTINFREMLAQRRIVLINTSVGLIGEDAGGLLGSVLLDTLNLTIREQMSLPPERRARVMVFIDEFQAIPGVDYASMLAELAKMGASFVLSTQSLAQLDVLDPSLRPIVLSNVDNLFVFSTSADDARTLTPELDDAVEIRDVINQADYTCYMKVKRGHQRLPVFSAKILPPLEANPEIARQVMEAVSSYTISATEADSSRHAFEATWYEIWQKAVRKDRVGEGPAGGASASGRRTARRRPRQPPSTTSQPQLPGLSEGTSPKAELP